MATSVPKGWSVEGGVVGTDFDMSDTTALSGGRAFDLLSTATVNARLCSDWILRPQQNVAGETDVSTVWYSVAATIIASSAAAGKDIRVVVEEANITRDTIVPTTIYNAPLPSAGKWAVVGDLINTGSTYNWMRVCVDRPTDIDFTAKVDSLEIKQLPAGIYAWAGVGSFSASWTIVPISTLFSVPYGFTEVDPGGSYPNQLFVYAPGHYIITADLKLEDTYSDGDMFGLRLVFRDSSGTIIHYAYGQTMSVPVAYNAATDHLSMNMTGCFWMRPQSSVELQAIQYTNTGTLKDYSTGSLHATRITDR